MSQGRNTKGSERKKLNEKEQQIYELQEVGSHALTGSVRVAGITVGRICGKWL